MDLTVLIIWSTKQLIVTIAPSVLKFLKYTVLLYIGVVVHGRTSLSKLLQLTVMMIII